MDSVTETDRATSEREGYESRCDDEVVATMTSMRTQMYGIICLSAG